MSAPRKTHSEPSKVGSAAAIAGFLGLGAFGVAQLIAPEADVSFALWLILPAYALAYWVIVPASRRRYGIPFQRKR
jgi:hypothetical protein